MSPDDLTADVFNTPQIYKLRVSSSGRKSMWNQYLSVAERIRLLNNDLLARLRDAVDDNFRGAWAECLAAWFLAEKLGLDIRPHPPGRGNSCLDLEISSTYGNISVEVKSPFREVKAGEVFFGLDSDAIQSAAEEANRQFSKTASNLLVLVPQLRISAYDNRYQLIRALFGQGIHNFLLDPDTGLMVGGEEARLDPCGHFLKRYQPEPTPRFTRIGAVLTIEERIDSGAGMIDHLALLAHNPHAKNPLPGDIWADLPQLIEQNGAMVWTDGRSPWD